jgi:hypothetical protein
MLISLPKDIYCLGYNLRDKGHSRVPEPPAMITGRNITAPVYCVCLIISLSSRTRLRHGVYQQFQESIKRLSSRSWARICSTKNYPSNENHGQRPSRCDFLAKNLSQTIVLPGDGSNQRLLTEENVGSIDVVVSVTGDKVIIPTGKSVIEPLNRGMNMSTTKHISEMEKKFT